MSTLDYCERAKKFAEDVMSCRKENSSGWEREFHRCRSLESQWNVARTECNVMNHENTSKPG